MRMLASVVTYKLIEHNNHRTNQPSICFISTSNSSFDSLPLNAIAEKTGLDTSKLLASLSQLELMGLISQLPGMRYSAI